MDKPAGLLWHNARWVSRFNFSLSRSSDCCVGVRALAQDARRAAARLPTPVLPVAGVLRAPTDHQGIPLSAPRDLLHPAPTEDPSLSLLRLRASLLAPEFLDLLLPEAAGAAHPGRRRPGCRLGAPAAGAITRLRALHGDATRRTTGATCTVASGPGAPAAERIGDREPRRRSFRDLRVHPGPAVRRADARGSRVLVRVRTRPGAACAYGESNLGAGDQTTGPAGAKEPGRLHRLIPARTRSSGTADPRGRITHPRL